jgi:hypothetical protein
VKTKRAKLLCIALTSLAVSYFISFAVLAYFGGYMTVASGQFRPFRLASGDTWVWQPRYGTFYRYRDPSGRDTHMADTVGYIYSPLICVIQHTARPSMRFVHADGSAAIPYPRIPTRSELHPRMQPVISDMERQFHISWEHPETWKQSK